MISNRILFEAGTPPLVSAPTSIIVVTGRCIAKTIGLIAQTRKWLVGGNRSKLEIEPAGTHALTSRRCCL